MNPPARAPYGLLSVFSALAPDAHRPHALLQSNDNTCGPGFRAGFANAVGDGTSAPSLSASHGAVPHGMNPPARAPVRPPHACPRRRCAALERTGVATPFVFYALALDACRAGVARLTHAFLQSKVNCPLVDLGPYTAVPRRHPLPAPLRPLRPLPIPLANLPVTSYPTLTSLTARKDNDKSSDKDKHDPESLFFPTVEDFSTFGAVYEEYLRGARAAEHPRTSAAALTRVLRRRKASVSRGRDGAQAVRIVHVRRNVRRCSTDLVKTGSSWAESTVIYAYRLIYAYRSGNDKRLVSRLAHNHRRRCRIPGTLTPLHIFPRLLHIHQDLLGALDAQYRANLPIDHLPRVLDRRRRRNELPEFDGYAVGRVWDLGTEAGRGRNLTLVPCTCADFGCNLGTINIDGTPQPGKWVSPALRRQHESAAPSNARPSKKFDKHELDDTDDEADYEDMDDNEHAENLGEKKHGKLKAEQYFTLFAGILPLAVPEIALHKDPITSDKMKDGFYHLVAATNIVSSFKTSDAEADVYTEEYLNYRRNLQSTFPDIEEPPNAHFAGHYKGQMRLMGPPAGISEFWGERMNGELQRIKTNCRLSE
ncbi:Peptidase-M24 domain-containing protein [Mycena kentingensis (nom. inval.)]|nr:Peptidase-M24 domain-containing protein [Mycena kentingensis (nom. inval.)]